MNYDKFDWNHEAEPYAKGKHNPVWVLLLRAILCYNIDFIKSNTPPRVFSRLF